MDLERAIKEYLNCRKQIETIDAEARKQKAGVRIIMGKLEQWITNTAKEQGLKDIPTEAGTGYWSTHKKCSVADQEVFFKYVKENERWDLIEKRASKVAVGNQIEATGEAVPGVNFSQVSVFTVRANNKDKEAA
jgi:hypothetical protein